MRSKTLWSQSALLFQRFCFLLIWLQGSFWNICLNPWKVELAKIDYYSTTQQCLFHELKKLKTDMMFENSFKKFNVFEKLSFTSILPQSDTIFTKLLCFWRFWWFLAIFSQKIPLIYVLVATWQIQNSTESRVFYLTNIIKVSNFSFWLQILKKSTIF